MHETLLIKNTSLYHNIADSTRYDILITKGKITCISPACNTNTADSDIDATGFIALPGLIDIHIHGAGGYDSLDGTKEAFVNISQTLASVGTTSFISTMVVKPGKMNTHLIAASECTGKNMGGAGLLGIYIEGPFINIEKKGGIMPESITEPSVAVLRRIFDETGSALKIMCLAPEIPGNQEIIRRLREKDIIAAFGHSDADYDETIKGFKMGISHVTHLYNAMSPLHHRRPGPLAAIFENDDITVELISDSHHIHPSLVRMAAKLKGTRNITGITDGISGLGLPDGLYTYNNRKYLSRDGLAKYLDGTLIGSTMSLLKIAKNFMDFTDSGIKEAIDTVTINPARILGIQDHKGSVETGMDADIVLIDSSFTVQYTIIDGKTVYRNNN